MKYELDGRIINIPDKDLERLQKSLNISQEEAISTWLVDEEYISDETVEELTEKAKKNHITGTIHGAKAENSQKKERKPREKKANPLKKQIIEAIYAGIADNIVVDGKIVVKNDIISFKKYILAFNSMSSLTLSFLVKVLR